MRQVALAVLLVILTSAAAAVLFSRPDGNRDEEETFQGELQEVLAELRSGYTAPMSAAARELDAACWNLPPYPRDPECAEFVEAIGEHDPVLSTSIPTLEALLSDIPVGVSGAVVVADAKRILAEITSRHESNQLLLEGWLDQDEDKWQRGWDVRGTVD